MESVYKDFEKRSMKKMYLIIDVTAGERELLMQMIFSHPRVSLNSSNERFTGRTGADAFSGKQELGAGTNNLRS